jgi:hypothetical protein
MHEFRRSRRTAKKAYSRYYSAKGNAPALRESALETLAEAWAAKNHLDKAKILLSLKHQEEQKETARRIKYLRGKLNIGSTTVISVQGIDGKWRDVTDRNEMELEIMKENEFKFKQATRTPFMIPPLVTDFGDIGTGLASDLVMEGVYQPPTQIDLHTKMLLEHLARPQAIIENGPHPISLPVDVYRSYWRKARENTSCYPGDLSFATLKAGAQSEKISLLECTLTRVPLFSGYTPSR